MRSGTSPTKSFPSTAWERGFFQGSLLLSLRYSALLFVLFVSFVSFVVSIPSAAIAEEPFFKKGDVIALVGGEDMVAMSEYGYLELLLTRALPGHRLKFRNLAWEGDTVFEQRRDLNFPPLEAQLDQVGATVVLCQFGQMESLAGLDKLPVFRNAFEKLLQRLGAGGRRKILVIPPTSFIPSARWSAKTLTDLNFNLAGYVSGVFTSAREVPGADAINVAGPLGVGMERTGMPDGMHLDEKAHLLLGLGFARMYVPALFGSQKLRQLGATFRNRDNFSEEEVKLMGKLQDEREKEIFDSSGPLRQLIIAKNRLWFDYWRVQNWAFLAGDRTEQPSSRDHVDRTKRWFPAEREQFLPLIEAKEQEIWTLAAKLSEQK